MKISLDDKYKLNEGIRFITGSQALVRLALVQSRIDKRNNLKTAGYISGYRGSPLGGFDQQILKNIRYINENNIFFQPGINEELAATSLWGTQQSNLYNEGKYDGVFGIWYGKGPGVDRAGDALKHVNLAGTSKFGGVLALMGDDHICESSTTSHQSEFAMVDAMIPVLNPSGVQEILDYGLYGFQLSRISGCWIGIKCVHDNVSSASTVDLNENRISINPVDQKFFSNGNLNIRLKDTPQEKEHRLHYYKMNVVKEFCRINNLNKFIYNPSNARIGIVSTGKSFLDTKEALKKLDIDDKFCTEFGIRFLKIAMTWPLEESIIKEFSKGLYTIIVIEEKRSLIENQIKNILFNINSSVNIIGKNDIDGKILFPSSGSLNPGHIAINLGNIIYKKHPSEKLKFRINEILKLVNEKRSNINFKRTPYFCSGCPHNTSTKLPDKSRALTGISCAYLVQNMERNNEGFTQMGAEGASWVGESIFSNREHIFQNIGDGTYIHSGILSIRHAVAAKTKMTFKILYNDAVALTGGQALDGLPSVAQISRQLSAEGVEKIAIITDDLSKYSNKDIFSKNTSIFHRKEIINIQIKFSKINGTTAIVYDQTCAAEKRRRIKKSLLPEPTKKIYINEEICEGCGDCGIQSNCVSILPVETELGRKRQIDQSNCNNDYSCVDGFCPSFVSLKGDIKLKKNINSNFLKILDKKIEDPILPNINKSYGIMIAGIGGTGVVTIGAILGTAAEIDGKGSGVLDMTGLAQKGGSVKSFLRIFNNPNQISTIRLSYNDTDLLLGCDLLVSNDDDVLLTLKKSSSKALINSDEVMTGEFTRNINLSLPSNEIKNNFINILGENNIDFLPSNEIARKILGDSIASNMFMVGFAYQSGFIPINSTAIVEAIKLNGVSIDLNLNSFNLGRHYFIDKKIFINKISENTKPQIKNDNEKIDYYYEYLLKYQNKKYADKFLSLVDFAKKYENEYNIGHCNFSNEVAKNFFRLMSYKDEYEVSRLYSKNSFYHKIRNTFEGNYKINFNLSPPIFSKKDPITNKPIKTEFGPWILYFLKILQNFKFLRNTPFDPFGYLEDRKIERKLIKKYQDLILNISPKLNKNNYNYAVEIASNYNQIRGFGHIKKKNIKIANSCEDKLMSAFNENFK
ncbi:MAG: hypothetical protein CFH21_00603 [Alphaproteobacteria bacterium MarineAlpha5_Bin11]|nr:indolepyruvate ferredoxin oxidoreductase [Pelagibacteraceae bacterium]PPR43927.1 MAG: hypothetical protein CFH21_00603 [Alphaproteobacteria bacterium MarineAlpha5_Bin11]|tara:strand:- start:15689 stop:19117 length:3429 start_codon:yes stop_codon:yes gene_type:complete